MTRAAAVDTVKDRNVFAAMMLHMGDADALLGGLTQDYPAIAQAASLIIPPRPGLNRISGLQLLFAQGQLYFLADCMVNVEPSSEELAEIAIVAADMARRFDVEPRVAMLSFSNFGSARHRLSENVRRSVEIVNRLHPELVIDGEVQADVAITPETLAQEYPFAAIKEGANVLIFPGLESGSIALKLLARLGGAEVIGPILMGLAKPVHVLRRVADVNDIVNMAAIAAVDAQAWGAARIPAAAQAVSARSEGAVQRSTDR
jgi:malate dehydrogenase (oxaloacetate-decarboxylating)(NADP+)